MSNKTYMADIPVDQWVTRWPHARLDQIEQHADRMRIDALNRFEQMCKVAVHEFGWTFNVNSSYRPSKRSMHGKGRAFDGYFYKKTPGDVSVEAQYVFALRFEWAAVGFYPYWNTPGLHVDNGYPGIGKRVDSGRRPTWWRDKSGAYQYKPEITYFSKGV